VKVNNYDCIIRGNFASYGQEGWKGERKGGEEVLAL
jgi:hypothetical protein